jgi:flagellar hook-associated protein 3 FlgL
MTRVTDFSQNQLQLFYLSNTQARLFDTQNQISTGLVAKNFAGIGADSSRLVSLQSAETRVNQYLSNAQIANQRLTSMETTTGQLFEIASKFQTLLINGLNAESSSDLNINQQAQDMLNQVAGLLNSQLDGRYLFAGTSTNVAPVDLNAAGFVTPPGVYPGTADTGYYTGNGTELSVRIDDNYDLSYGVTADAPGFEELIRSLRLAADANVGPPQDRNRLEESLRLAKGAIQDIPTITSQIGSAQAAIENIQSKHTDFKQFADKAIGDISNVDVTEAVTRLSEDQVTLEASYQVIARLSQLSLSRFLPSG